MITSQFLRGSGKISILFTSLISLLLFATTALADFSFQLVSPNANLASYGAGPYATVYVDWIDATHATIKVEAISPYTLVDGGILDLNINGSYSVQSITYEGYAGAGYVTEDSKNPASQKIDDQGYFNLVLNAANSANPLTSVAVSLIGSWATDQDILLKNAVGNLAAAHISAGPGQTGYAGSVPLPPAVWLFGAGMIGLFGVHRREFFRK